MAATDKSYIDSLKELRSIRMQQMKQMSSDQRYHSIQADYNRRLIRYNELFVSNLKDMTTKLGSAISGLSSKLVSGVGGAASGVASGVSSLSGLILSGLGKALPVGIAGLMAKALLWDNMSSQTQGRLSTAFGNIIQKLMKPLMGMVNNIMDGFKSLDIKFPLFTELFDRFTKFFEILQSGFKLISLKFESFMETFNKDPNKYIKDTLNLLGSTAALGLISIVASKVVLQMFRNSLLLDGIDNLLNRRMGGPRGVSGSRGGPGAPIVPLGGKQAGGGGGGGGAASSSPFERKYPKLSAAKSTAVKESVKTILTRGGARLVGSLAGGPVLTLLGMGWLAYDVYSLLKKFGVSDEDAEDAVNMVYPEGFVSVDPLSGKISGVMPAKEIDPEIKRRGMEARTKGATIPNVDVLGTSSGTSTLIYAEELSMLQAYEANQQKFAKQLKLESGKDVAAFVIEDFMAKWASMDKSLQRMAIELRHPIVQTANYIYYMGKDGNIKKMKQDQYLDAMFAFDDIEEETKEGVRISLENARKALADLTLSGEAGAAGYDAMFLDPKLKGLKPPGGKKVSELTMREVKDLQSTMFKMSGHTPIGGYQFVKNTLFGTSKEPGIVKEAEMDQIFNPQFQDELFKRLVDGHLQTFLNSDMTKADKDKFKTHMKKTWEIFQGKTKGAQVFADKLDAMIDSPEIMQAQSNRQTNVVRTKAERSAEENMLKKNIERLTKETTAPLDDTTLMSIRGESVAGMAAGALSSAKKSVKEYMEKAERSISPEGLTSDLVDTLKMINEVRGATDISTKGPDVYNINNINNSSQSGVSSGASKGVHPVYAVDTTAHRTAAGLA